MLYIPDTVCESMEEPVSPHFLTHTRLLMKRWFGNMIRHSNQALALGPKKIPFFVWWCLLDQRISPWTTMIGPTGAFFLALIYPQRPDSFLCVMGPDQSGNVGRHPVYDAGAFPPVFSSPAIFWTGVRGGAQNSHHLSSSSPAMDTPRF
jgi:hypothetical protein